MKGNSQRKLKNNLNQKLVILGKIYEIWNRAGYGKARRRRKGLPLGH
jgi:hypothetical protein